MRGPQKVVLWGRNICSLGEKHFWKGNDSFLSSLSSCVHQRSLADGLPLGSPAMDNFPILVFALLEKCLLGAEMYVLALAQKGQICQPRSTQQPNTAHTSMQCWRSSSSEAGPLQLPSPRPVFPNVSWLRKAPLPPFRHGLWHHCEL